MRLWRIAQQKYALDKSRPFNFDKPMFKDIAQTG